MSGLNKRAPVFTLFLCLALVGFILLRADVRNLSGEAKGVNAADIRLLHVHQSETHLSDFPTTRFAEFYEVSLEKSRIEFEIYFDPRTNRGAIACSLGRYWVQDAYSPEEVARKFLRGEGGKMN